jgi:tRNA modification GTPase
METIDRHIKGSERGVKEREGLIIGVHGAPNAGKSSLANYLANREASIVSPFAGTTRDIIEIHLRLGGFPVIFCDTAGIRNLTEKLDFVEQEGIRRAIEKYTFLSFLIKFLGFVRQM